MELRRGARASVFGSTPQNKETRRRKATGVFDARMQGIWLFGCGGWTFLGVSLCLLRATGIEPIGQQNENGPHKAGRFRIWLRGQDLNL
ncbi:hypothetical protein NKJ23_00830 [Mesorhizobium sp. M0184]|uniref:hypothetical protein n=1 Tax=Mesorhizobium sp. M0184 TaxID=2956906 RepID=UPI0033363FEC